MRVPRSAPFRPSAPLYMLITVIVLATAHMVHFYPLLPETVASHFGDNGEPNGWMSRNELMALYGGLVALFVVLPLISIALLPKCPSGLINMPRKDYWLAPERKAQTCATVNGLLMRICSATVAFLIATMHLTFRANLGETSLPMQTFWMVLGAYVLFIAIWTVGFYVTFLRVPEDDDT